MVPLEVVIREPKRKFSEVVARFIGGVAAIFLIAWLVMLISPLAVPGFEPSYWQSVSIVILGRLVIPHHPFPHLASHEKNNNRAGK